MKNLKATIKASLNEARSYPYSVDFSIGGKIVKTEVILENPSDAKIFDKWIEDEIDNNVYHAEGGPNDIEL